MIRYNNLLSCQVLYGRMIGKSFAGKRHALLTIVNKVIIYADKIVTPEASKVLVNALPH
jgi:hypothetical protein